MSEIYWSQFRNNPQHTGRSAVPSFRNPTLRWEKAVITETSFFEEIIIGQNGTLYIPTEKGCEAFDSITGQRKWFFPTTSACHGIAVDVFSKLVYIQDDIGTHWTLDAMMGEQISSFSIPSKIMASYQTIAPNGAVYFWSDLTKLYAFAPAEEPRLIFEAFGTPIITSYGESVGPAIGLDGTLYFGTVDGKIYALSPEGEEKWSQDVSSAIQQAPAIGSDGAVYFSPSSEDENKLLVFTSNGELKWIFNSDVGYSSSLAIGLNDTIYLAAFDGTVYAVNSDGNQEWTFSTFPIYSGVSVSADGVIYFSSTDGYIYALNPDGSLLWKLNIDDDLNTSPIIGPDGTLYVCSSVGMYAIGPRL